MHLKGNRIGAYARYSSDKQNVSSVDDQLRRFRPALAPNRARIESGADVLLECAASDGVMVIAGARNEHRYYVCSNYRRGRCNNAKSVPAARVKQRMMESIKERLCSPEGISYARKKVAEHLGEVERNREAQMNGTALAPRSHREAHREP